PPRLLSFPTRRSSDLRAGLKPALLPHLHSLIKRPPGGRHIPHTFRYAEAVTATLSQSIGISNKRRQPFNGFNKGNHTTGMGGKTPAKNGTNIHFMGAGNNPFGTAMQCFHRLRVQQALLDSLHVRLLCCDRKMFGQSSPQRFFRAWLSWVGIKTHAGFFTDTL